MDFLIAENEISQKIDKYFHLMESFYGEEVAVETTTVRSNILNSLMQFSNGFDFLDSSDVYAQLLSKVALVDTKDNVGLAFIKEKIQSKDIETAVQAIESNLGLKRTVVSCYIRHLTPNRKLFEYTEDKKSAKIALNNLYEYRTVEKKNLQHIK